MLDRAQDTAVSASAGGGACSLLVWAGVALAGRWVGHLS
jgi:hypothetical protein